MYCSYYSLGFSRKEPHAASEDAKTNVEVLQSELEKLRVGGGSLGYLNELRSVPKASLAMLICKALPPSELARDMYPRRPPIVQSGDSDGIYRSPIANLVMPAFLVHFN